MQISLLQHRLQSPCESAVAVGVGETACKFAEKVYNAQEAGAQAVSLVWLALRALPCTLGLMTANHVKPFLRSL